MIKMNRNSQKIIILVLLCTFLMSSTIIFLHYKFSQNYIIFENEDNLKSPNSDLKTSASDV